jgi:hypothetical protein
MEGLAEISSNTFICICGHCGKHDAENATIEFNFREQKVYYLCSQCKKMNELFFGKQNIPMPKTRLV